MALLHPPPLQNELLSVSISSSYIESILLLQYRRHRYWRCRGSQSNRAGAGVAMRLVVRISCLNLHQVQEVQTPFSVPSKQGHDPRCGASSGPKILRISRNPKFFSNWPRGEGGGWDPAYRPAPRKREARGAVAGICRQGPPDAQGRHHRRARRARC